jgi:hypothetical protein
MATPCGVLISTLLRRVRDPHAIGTTRTLTRTLLSRAQVLLNARDRLVLTTETLTTQPRCQIYPVHASLPLSQRILRVRDVDDRNLDWEHKWRNLANYSVSWFRKIANQHYLSATIGRDLLVVHPAKNVESTVTVLSVKLTTELVEDDTALEIAVADEDALLDIAELMMSVKNRNLTRAMELLKGMQNGEE